MWEQLKRRSSYQALPTIEPKKDVYRDLHHPVFQSIRVVQVITVLSKFDYVRLNHLTVLG
jgi:DNA-binding cell septation regulator SpoVG